MVLKSHEVVTSFGFNKSKVNQCIYLKVRESKFIFLVIYVDDVLLASNNTGLLHHMKQFYVRIFRCQILVKLYFFPGIEIHRDRSTCFDRFISKYIYIEF